MTREGRGQKSQKMGDVIYGWPLMHRMVNPISSIETFPGHFISHTRRIIGSDFEEKNFWRATQLLRRCTHAKKNIPGKFIHWFEKRCRFFSNQTFMYHEALIIWSTYIPKSWLNNESKMHRGKIPPGRCMKKRWKRSVWHCTTYLS